MSYRYEGLYIMHYGVGHDKGGHSGRYPWGSGEEPYQDLSAAERRQKLLDKHWYHKGAKTRLGVDHIRDVDPNTKLSDLFKYNKRTTSDVLADKVLTYMYGDTEMDREELRRKKYNLMSAITAAEAVAATAVLVGGISSIKKGMNFLTDYTTRKIASQAINSEYNKIIQDSKIAANNLRLRDRWVNDPTRRAAIDSARSNWDVKIATNKDIKYHNILNDARAFCDSKNSDKLVSDVGVFNISDAQKMLDTLSPAGKKTGGSGGRF